MNNSNEFYNIARSFCLKIETTPKFEISNCREILLLLSKLYNEALQLPDVEPLNDVKFDVERIRVSFEELDIYWEIYNPYECDEPVCGSLSDDFGDIYVDLKTGVTLYEKGYVNDAVWNWKWSFENHWSYHLVDAMRALNQMNDMR